MTDPIDAAEAAYQQADLDLKGSEARMRAAIAAYLRKRREAIIREPMDAIDYERAQFLSEFAAEVERGDAG